MDARDIVPIILWPWLIVSIVILLRRSINKRSSAATPEPLPETIPPPRPTGPDRPTAGAAPEPSPATSPGPAPIAAPPPHLAVSEGGSIFDAPPDLPPTAPRASIAEMVRGIELPCDLTPLVGVERPIGARESAAFVTRTHDATTVGRAMGEELRRLEFDLTTRHATEVVATRGEDWLIVAVHPAADSVERGDRPAFPGAGPGSVVVEIWTE